CRNFLANLLDLSSREPRSVEQNVRTLIQELIDAQVEPEEFCDRLERLLNASPQPCLIGFLKKSLPLLGQSLVTKELVIEGINPPAPHVAFSNVPAPTQATIATSNLQTNEDSGNTLTTLMPPVVTLASTAIVQTQPGKTINIISSSQIQAPQVNNQPKSLTGQKSNVSTSKNNKPPVTVFSNVPVYSPKVIQRGKGQMTSSKMNFMRSTTSTGLQTVLTPGKSLLKDKEKKTAFSPAFPDDKMAGDDDINDVAAMGGVNLAEESQRILGSTELIGQQIRQMQSKIRSMTMRHNLEEPNADISALLSHALQEYLKNIIEKLVDISQHRGDLSGKADNRFEVTQDVKSQLKFLEDLDRVDKKRREDSEREMLIRAAKSRSKNEDPEQAKLKAKAKEMQRAEMEELRQREANLTALQAIGPRKKPRLDGTSEQTSVGGSQNQAYSGRSQMALRSRLKRINHRDMLCLLEQFKNPRISMILYRSYLK
ncbi:Transcription initiation factor TFIID subunit 4, partial [Eumeta japonica]